MADNSRGTMRVGRPDQDGRLLPFLGQAARRAAIEGRGYFLRSPRSPWPFFATVGAGWHGLRGGSRPRSTRGPPGGKTGRARGASMDRSTGNRAGCSKPLIVRRRERGTPPWAKSVASRSAVCQVNGLTRAGDAVKPHPRAHSALRSLPRRRAHRPRRSHGPRRRERGPDWRIDSAARWLATSRQTTRSEAWRGWAGCPRVR